MKRVLLLVDQKGRDLASVLLIGEYLRAFGIHVSYCNKINMLAMAEQIRPDVLVLSCSEGQYKDLACYVAPHCKIALMTQEGACSTKERTITRHTVLATEKTYISGLSRVYLWSEISKTWLVEEKIYPEEIIRVFGTSRFDSYRVLEKRKFDPAKKLRVGFANRGATVNPAAKLNPVQELDAVRAKHGPHRVYTDVDREWEDWVWHSLASLRVNLNLVEMLAASGKYEIIFRPDPYENSESYNFLKNKYSCFQVNTDPILSNFISEIDVLVTEFSTVGLEALVVKKPVISTQKIIEPRLSEHTRIPAHVNPLHMQFYWKPENEAGFMKTLSDVVTEKVSYAPEPEKAEEHIAEFYNLSLNETSSAYFIARDLAVLCSEKKSAAMTELHQSEYIEHPTIKRLSQQSHLPRWLIKKLFLNPFIVNVKGLCGAIKRRERALFLRAHFFSWQRKDIRAVKEIFEKLKKSDAIFLKR
jgi:surface carbohydrate biosynthesis protein